MPSPSSFLSTLCLLPMLAPCARPQVALSWTAGHYTITSYTGPAPAAAASFCKADLDGDGMNETVALSCGRAVLRRGDRVLWRSNPAWRVTHAVLADSNHDGRIELNLALWKRGSFGPSKPFFVKRNDEQWGCHIFIYAWRSKALRCIWGSSAIDRPIRAMVFADLRGDAKPDLIVLEAPPNAGAIRESPFFRCLSVWRWNGWGFTNQLRCALGHYAGLRTAQLTNRQIVLIR